MTLLPSPLGTTVAAGGARPSRTGRTKTMSSSTGRQTAISLTPPPKPRLRLQPDRSARMLLDGGWWPRSADPAAELPGLILALDERHGSINRIMLGMADWDSSRPRRLRVDGPAGSRVVRLGWFAASPRPAHRDQRPRPANRPAHHRPHRRQATGRARCCRGPGAARTPDRLASPRHQAAGSRPVTRVVL